MHDRWIRLREELLVDLTPFWESEELAAYCNSNYWVVSYDARGSRVLKNDCHLTQAESFTDPRVARRIFWCPRCSKSTPCESPTAVNRHIATDPAGGFREVLETRPGYFEELYFLYPSSYLEYRDQALAWLKLQPEEKRKKLLTGFPL